MANIIDSIINAKNSKPYIDYKNYHRNNLLGIMSVSRKELPHSNFIAWLLDDQSLLYQDHFGIYLLIEMIYKHPLLKVDQKAVLTKFLYGDYITKVEVKREYQNIDILILVTTKDKILPIIIENKIDAGVTKGKKNDSKDQTDKYHDWATKEYEDTTKYFEPLFIFLKPSYNDAKPKCPEFLIVLYQELVDGVIEPIMHNCSDPKLKQNINIYLQSLSYQEDAKKGDRIVAMSSEEREILEKFIESNKPFIVALSEKIKEDYPDLAPAIDKFIKAVRDYTKYMFQGNVYNKRNLVFAVVKEYIRQVNPQSLKELQQAFPKGLRDKNHEMVILDTTDKDPDRWHKEVLDVGSDKVIVNNQWGDNIPNFIEHVKNKLAPNLQDFEIRKA